MLSRHFIPPILILVSSLLPVAHAAFAEQPSHVRCASRMFERERALALDAVRPSRGGPAWRGRSKKMTPPANPNVGDSWNWYIWSLNGPPTATLRSCTVRGEGANCYIVVENSQWNVNVTQAQVDTIVARFDSHTPGPYPAMGIFDIDTTAFGVPPDELDNDPKIYLLYYNFDVAADGFFWVFDEYPDGTQAYASNECEVVYLNSFGSGDVAGDFMLAVAAHEFEHLIHWNHDEDEHAWVDEGCAELAMWLYGSPDQISAFPTAPNDPLTIWDGAWTDYIQCYLWSLYFFERYGGIESVRALVAEAKNSVSGYDQLLADLGYSERFADVFGDWTAANFADDPTIGDGRYGYVGEDIPEFVAVDHASHPVGPLNKNVRPTGCKYRRMFNGSSMRFFFDGSDDAEWRPKLIFYNGTTVIDVQPLILDALNAGDYQLADFGALYDTVVVAFPHASTYGANNITFGTDQATTAPAGQVRFAALGPNRPNPFNPRTEIPYAVSPGATDARVRLAVFDVTGRVVRTLVDGTARPGDHVAVWDGTDGEGRDVGSGTYFYRLHQDGRTVTRRMQLIR